MGEKLLVTHLLGDGVQPPLPLCLPAKETQHRKREDGDDDCRNPRHNALEDLGGFALINKYRVAKHVVGSADKRQGAGAERRQSQHQVGESPELQHWMPKHTFSKGGRRHLTTSSCACGCDLKPHHANKKGLVHDLHDKPDADDHSNADAGHNAPPNCKGETR